MLSHNFRLLKLSRHKHLLIILFIDALTAFCSFFPRDFPSFTLQPLPRGLAAVTQSTSTEGGNQSAAANGDQSALSSEVYPQAHTLIDPSLLQALRDADAKRPILLRQSLGVVVALTAAAAGSSTIDMAARGDDGGGSSTDVAAIAAGGTGGDGSLQRRRRAAALEQGRVLKKLKVKGTLVD